MPGRGKAGGRNPYAQDDPNIYSFPNTPGGDRRETGDWAQVEAAIRILEHIPLIARAPGAHAGHISKEIAELYDVMATVLEMASVQSQHTHFARSLMPQFRAQPGDPERAAFSAGHAPRGLRNAGSRGRKLNPPLRVPRRLQEFEEQQAHEGRGPNPPLPVWARA